MHSREPISDKESFYQAWLSGRLGNRPRAWYDEAALLSSGYSGRVSIRYRVPMGDRWKRYQTPVADVPSILDGLCQDGASRSLFTFNESMPDDRLILQGEVARVFGGLSLRYSTEPGLQMRAAMSRGLNAERTAASAILGAYLDASSHEDILELLDLYPDHAVEFSAYEMPVGELAASGRRAVIWEVRRY